MDDLKPYDFIALVNVEAVSPPDTTDQFKGMRLSGTFKMKVMTLFKGEAVDEITDPLVRTDCAMGFIKGQQWLVFGYLQDGKIITSICSYSILYRDASGRRLAEL